MKHKIKTIVTIRQRFTNHLFDIGERVQIINIKNQPSITKHLRSHYNGIQYRGKSIKDSEEWEFWEQDLQFPIKELLKNL